MHDNAEDRRCSWKVKKKICYGQWEHLTATGRSPQTPHAGERVHFKVSFEKVVNEHVENSANTSCVKTCNLKREAPSLTPNGAISNQGKGIKIARRAQRTQFDVLA